MKRFLELARLFPRSSRLPFLIGSVIPVGLGTALAFVERGLFAPGRFTLTVLGMAGAHLAVNFFNDYFDFRYGVDTAHPPRPFSGGSQVIQEGLETPAEVLAQALLMSGLAVAAALALAAASGPGVLFFAALGGFLGYFYSARPLLLSWRGLGELVTGFCFGPLVVAGSYFVQAGHISAAGLVLSLVPGALITALLFVNQYPDYHQDLRAGKKTLVVRLGPRRALPLLYLLLAAAFAPLFLARALPHPLAPPLPLPLVNLALVGLIPAALAAYFLTVEKEGRADNKPGQLMLVTYTVTLSLLLLGTFIP
jgi:1,4-dihydroxy-2-naphthoate octaprenyltransferase